MQSAVMPFSACPTATELQFEVAQTETHFEQILDLQRQNLRSALSETEQTSQGFVYAEHTLPLLRQLASRLPQIVATHEGKVVAYNLAMHASMKDTLPCLSPMFAEFERCQFGGNPLLERPFIVGGQVCVAAAYRGQGLLKRLYHATRQHVGESYELCVTEIAEQNKASLRAHEKMGFKIIRSYQEDRTLWHIVAWPMRQA